MEKMVFQCKMGLGKVVFTIENNELRVKFPMGNERVYKKGEIVKLDFKNISNPFPGIGYAFYFYIFYNKNGKSKKKTFIFSYQDREAQSLMKALIEAFPEANYIGPNENEKRAVVSPDFTGIYRIHALWPMVWFIVMFLIFAPVGVLFYLTSNIGKDAVSSVIGIIFLLMSLGFLDLVILIGIKKIYFIKTNSEGFTYKKLIKKDTLNWKDLKIGEIRFKEKIMQGDYSTSTDAFFEIPFLDSTKNVKLKLTSFMAGELFAELYYRNVITLEQAKYVGTFF